MRADWDTLTDSQKLWWLMKQAGAEGVHSHDLRAQGVSGNPSSRAKDCVSKGQPVFTAREARGKRPGARYWLQNGAPDFAVPVAPNGAAAPLSAEPYVLHYDAETNVWSERPAHEHLPVAA